MSLPEDKYRPEIPEDYFNNLNAGLDKKLMEEEIFDLKEYPILNGIRKGEDFSVPDNHLLHFEASKFYAPKRKTQTLRLVAFAASILIAVSIFALSVKKEIKGDEEINPEEILNYFALENEDLEDLYIDDSHVLLSAISKNRFTNIEEAVLIDYLIEDLDQLDLALLY